MHRFLVLFVLIAVLFIKVSLASDSLSFTMQPHYFIMNGLNEFSISAEEFNSEIGANVRVESKLEFPLDVSYLGLGFTSSLSLDTTTRIEGKLIAAKSINDPDEPMTDKDWLKVPSYGYSMLFSSTESTSKLDAYFINTELMYSFLFQPKMRLEPLLGFRYYHFNHDIFGIKGWQYDNGVKGYLDGYHDENVLDYEVNIYSVFAGCTANMQLSPKFQMTGKLAYSPFTYADDKDVHILRNKKAVSNTSGTATFYSIGLNIKLDGPRKLPDIFLSVNYEIIKLTTEGEQTQTWYGDDPATDQIDDTGASISGIDNDINLDISIIKFNLKIEL